MILEFRNLKKSYGDNEILHGLNFKVESGRALAFLGRNGAGKTTTIRALMDVFKPDSGEILLDGKNIDRNKVSIGYLPEERGMYAKENILKQLVYFGMLRGGTRAETKKSALDLLEKVGLSDYANKKLETLSKGNQQKVQIVEAMLNDPDILVLDEPFSGLDPVNSKILMMLIRKSIENNKIVLFSSHQMSYVDDICKDIALIEKGNIVLHGELEEIKREMGKNRLRLQVSDYQKEELKEIIKEMGFVCESDEKTIIIDLSGRSKSELLEKILQNNLNIELFSDYKPTVSEIFISYLGKEENENEKHA